MSKSFNSSLKGLGRALARIEKANARERQKALKQYQKQQALENASAAVRQFEEYLDALQSFHQDVQDPIDWSAMLEEKAPLEPVRSYALGDAAAQKRAAFKPNFLVRAFGFTGPIIRSLDKKVDKAKEADTQKNQRAQKKHVEELQDWETRQALARGVIDKDGAAWQQVFEYLKPFTDIEEVGGSVEIIYDSEVLTLELTLPSDDFLPKQSLSLTSTGKLSKKNMTNMRKNELYKNFVCSCVLRAAREAMSALPAPLVMVHALCDYHNTVTGEVGIQPILSAAFTKKDVSRVYFDRIVPGDAIMNFPHQLNFSKTNGLVPILRLDPKTLVYR